VTEFLNVVRGPTFDFANRSQLLGWEREQMVRGTDYAGRALHPDFVAKRLAEIDAELADICGCPRCACRGSRCTAA
jgi:hypothetical protein